MAGSKQGYRVNVASVHKRLPAGFTPPAGFDGLVRLCLAQPRGALGWFRIEGADPSRLRDGARMPELSPFLKLPDGGVIAWWFEPGRKVPAVVWLGSEGEHAVVGGTFAHFLARLATRKTGVFDLDDQSAAVLPAAWRRAKAPTDMAARRRRFKAYLKAHEPVAAKIPADVGEAVRAAVIAAVGRRRLREDSDLEELFVTLTDRTFEVQWYDGGLVPFPRAERLRKPMTRLREVLGHSLRRCHLSVWGDGAVIVENTELRPVSGPRADRA